MKRINKKLIMYKIDFLKPKQKIIKELLLQSIYISIYYPTINVDPENFGKAYQVVYNQYYSLLSHSLLKVDKIKVQHTVIEDDKNFTLLQLNIYLIANNLLNLIFSLFLFTFFLLIKTLIVLFI